MDKTLQKQAEIGNRIAFLLEKKGCSQTDLANKSGIGEPSISDFIKGKRNLSLKMIVRLETALSAKLIIVPKD